MAQQSVTHFYPDAQVIFVKRFQLVKEETNIDDVIAVASNIGDIQEIQSISTEITVRNNSGTFNITLSDTANKFISPDNPQTEIPALYKNSKRESLTSGVTRGVSSSNSSKVSKMGVPINGSIGFESLNAFVVPSPFGHSVDDTAQSLPTVLPTESRKLGNFFEFKTYTDWKNFKHVIIESLGLIDEDDKGDFYPTQYIRSTVTTKITERWALDKLGNIIYIASTEAEEDNLQRLLESNSGGFLYECKVLTPTQSTKSQAIKVNYKIKGFKNEEFVTKYKDFDEQGEGESIKRGKCKISPMDRVVIFMRQRFGYENQNIMTQVFTGVVDSVQQDYSENNSTIVIQGTDVTKYLQLSIVNVNPALLIDDAMAIDQFPDPQNKPTIFTQIFKGMKATKIVEILLLGGATTDTSRTLDGIGQYKIARTSSGKNLVLDIDTGKYNYVQGSTTVDGDSNTASFQEALGDLFTKSAVHIIDPFREGSELSGYDAYRIQLNTAFSFYQADFKTRRDLIYQLAEDTQSVFFADRRGHIWFRPPYYNNSHILGAKDSRVYVIKNDAIKSYGFIESDQNIFSSVYVDTEPPFGGEGVTQLGMYRGSYRDDGIVLKYGVRLFSATNPIIKVGNRDSLILYAKSLLQRLASGKYQGQITITGRAEIEPGRPIFIPIRNMIYYVETVGHNYSAGGEFLTTLHLSFGRKPWEHIAEILTFSESDDLYLTDGAIYNDELSDIEINNPGGFLSDSTKLSAHFTLRQFTRSDLAVQYGLPNNPSQDSINNMKKLCSHILEPLQAYLKTAITVSSGYRSPVINKILLQKLGSKRVASNSHHMYGMAVDFTVPNMTSAFSYIRKHLPFTQLIKESTWIHVSYDENNLKKQVIY